MYKLSTYTLSLSLSLTHMQIKEDVKLPDHDKLHRPPPPQPDASPGRITRQETNSIFDELIYQLNEVSEELDHPLSPSRGGTVEDTVTDSHKNTIFQGDADSTEIVEKSSRPMSTVSEQTDMYSNLSHPHQQRGPASRTVSLSSATLPKKSRGKWLHRVGSPLLKSRKSFTSSPGSKRRKNKEHVETKEGVSDKDRVESSNQVEGGAKKKGSRRIFTRKRSLPEIYTNSTTSTPATTPTIPRTSSSDNFPVKTESTFNHLPNQLSKEDHLLSPPMPHPPRVGSRQGDPVTNSLELMVTLSRNKECLSTLISYICMPKCETR